MTVAQARALDISDEELALAVDETQGIVHSGEAPVAYLVLRVTR